MILVYDVNTIPEMDNGMTFDSIVDFYKDEKILLYSSTNNNGEWGGEKPFFIKENGELAEILTVDLKDMTATEFIKIIKSKRDDNK